MPLVLSLLDQLYEVRRQMKALTGALRQQPDEVQRAIVDLIEATRRQGGRLD
jgi:chaperone modulatory protein CbpM